MVSISRRIALFAVSALALAACGAANGAATPGAGASSSALGHTLGSADAPITIIEYASPTCPACKFFHDAIKPVLQERFISTGKVQFIFKDYPLNSIDVAAYAIARCAGEGRFFDVLDDLFANQEGIRQAAASGVVTTALLAVAQRHGIPDQEAFDACMNDADIRQAIADTYASGEQYSVDGTPTFIINGVKRNFSGDFTNPEGFSRHLDGLLATLEAGN
ncbi:DsbA family protein [Hyphomonas sp.]|uniref:DsbA family protein n=1 Tax=Hyphomonas sp. TaxID=87 RepID=UPI0039189412